MGLVEMGHDIRITEQVNDSNVFTPELVEYAVRDLGADLSGREIEAIESGEFFKD